MLTTASGAGTAADAAAVSSGRVVLAVMTIGTEMVGGVLILVDSIDVTGVDVVAWLAVGTAVVGGCGATEVDERTTNTSESLTGLVLEFAEAVCINVGK